MSIYPAQPVFARGELSPRLASRIDLEYFKTGLATCKNWMVMRQGGIRRRPGTQYAGEVKNGDQPVRLIPFIFNASQAYVLEFGDYYFRVYTNGGRVGTVEVVTPWAMSELYRLDFDQTNDVLDVTHPSFAPRRIRRLSDTSWDIITTPINDGPYLDSNVTKTAILPGGTGNAVPAMTSNTAPSGVADASSNATDAWKAFDADPGSEWKSTTGAIAVQLSYQFASSKVIVGYSVRSSPSYIDAEDNGAINAPKSWNLEAYNGSSWVTLDTQYGQLNWSLGEGRYYSFSNEIAYTSYRINVLGNNLGKSTAIAQFSMLESPATQTPITLSANYTTGINGGAGFDASDVGRYVSLLGSDAIYHPFRITGYSSATLVFAVAVGAPLPSQAGGPQWKMGAWGGVAGWPARVCTFEGRKAFARTNLQPNGVWLTKSGGYGNSLDFATSVPSIADDALSFILADVNEIQWIAEGEVMMMGTAGAARTLGRDSLNEPFSAVNFRQKPASFIGSQAIRPAKAEQSTVFSAFFGKAVREFTRSDNGVDFDTPDLSVLSEHLFAAGIKEMTYQQEPDSVFWFLRNDGKVVGLTYEKAQSMAGMHWVEAGGDGAVQSICVIPGDDRHELWMVVRRTINGGTKQYIERMMQTFDYTQTAPEDAWHLDCAIRYEGAPATVITGLGYLEGQTVSILADGALEADAAVTGGSITLASGRAASKVLVGYSYESEAITLNSNAAIGDGSGIGRKKKIVKVMVDVLATGSLKVGSPGRKIEEIVLRNTGNNVGEAVPLQTGFRDARYDSSWSDDGRVRMVADGPLPAVVRAIIPVTEPGP